MNHYGVLGVPNSATLLDIKKAYHQLALKFHPDKLHFSSFASEEEFKKIQTAYEILSNIEARRHYDAELDSSCFSFLGGLFTACLNTHRSRSEEDASQPTASPQV